MNFEIRPRTKVRGDEFRNPYHIILHGAKGYKWRREIELICLVCLNSYTCFILETALAKGLTGTKVTATKVTGTKVTGTKVIGTKVTGMKVTGTKVTGTKVMGTMGTLFIFAKK